MKTILLGILLFNLTLSSQPKMWIPNGSVNQITINGNYTYLAGAFSYVGPLTGSGVLMDLPTQTENPNFPQVNGTIFTVIPDGNGGWYIGGNFTKVGFYNRNFLAQINSDGTVSDWNPDVTGVGVYTIAIDGNNIFIGGDFSVIGGQQRHSLAKLNNTTGAVDPLWIADVDDKVNSIVVNGENIFVGGSYNSIGGQTKKYLAKLNTLTGTVDDNWNLNPNSIVEKLLVDGNNLFVGGPFTTIGGLSIASLAKLDLTTGTINPSFKPYGNTAYSIGAIKVDNQIVYAARNSNNYCWFDKLNYTSGVPFSNWSPGFPYPRKISTVIINGNDIYVSALFYELVNIGVVIPYNPKYCIFKIDKATGSIDPTWLINTNGNIYDLSITGNKAYVGGSFNSIGGFARKGLAKLDNTTGKADPYWNPEMTISQDYPHITPYVQTIAVNGNDVFIGGLFHYINGSSIEHLAKLDNITGAPDTTWNAHIPHVTYNPINKILIRPDNIYVGGSFVSIGGQPRKNIAKLNLLNASVDPLWNANLTGNAVTAMTSNDSSVFASLYSNPITQLLKLNTNNGVTYTSWNPDQVNGEVYNLTLTEGDLYIGSTNEILKVNNQTGTRYLNWGIPVPPNSDFRTFAIKDDMLFVGSYYWGGGTGKRLAKFHLNTAEIDTSWNTYVQGLYPAVISIALDGDNIYVGGNFDMINNFLAPNFVLITPEILTPVKENNIFETLNSYSLKQNFPNPYNSSTTISFFIPKEEKVKVKVYNILGKEVASLIDGVVTYGLHSVHFEGKDLPSGVYFYRIETGSFIETKKMILLK